MKLIKFPCIYLFYSHIIDIIDIIDIIGVVDIVDVGFKILSVFFWSEFGHVVHIRVPNQNL